MRNTPGSLQSWFSEQLSDFYEEHEIRSMFFLILDELLLIDRISFLTEPGRKIAAADVRKIEKVIRRLKLFEPVQQILGKTVFYGLPFLVDKNVLIPRPETEELVDLILEDFKNPTFTGKSKKENNFPVQILDVGTGSGCIAISLSKNISGAEVWASDIAAAALHCAEKNAEKNEVKIRFLCWDVFSDELPESLPALDILVSNPPYVRESEKLLMKPNVLFYEPESALFVNDQDPLVYYRRIAAIGQKHLRKGGRLYVEINEAFGNQTATLFENEGFKDGSLFQDIHGRDRMIRCIK